MNFDVDVMEVLDFLLKVLSAAVLTTATVWKFLIGRIGGMITEAVASEKKDRETADKNIEGVVQTNSQTIHNALGQIDVMERTLQDQERQRVKEMHELKSALQQGLHNIELQLARLKPSKEEN